MAEDFLNIAKDAITIGVDELNRNIAAELANGIPISEVMQALVLFENEYKSYRSLILAKRKMKASSASLKSINDIRNQIKNRQEYIYSLFFDFQNKFNAYINQKIQMVFVYHGENGENLLGISDNDLSHVVVNQYGKLEYSISNLSLLLKQEEDYDDSSLNTTANEIYRRWDIAKSNIKKSVGLPILWKDKKGQWTGAKVNNKGTIAEAYANFYINMYIFQSDMETNIGTYVMDSEYGMLSVDNTLGFAIGDIDKSQVQYAVKTQRAGLMGMYRVYQYIQTIRKNLGTNFTEQELLKQLENRVKKKSTVKQVHQLANNIETTYQDLIKNLD